MKNDQSRRRFLKTSGLGIAAGLAAPNLSLAQKSGAKKPVVGEGEFQYECHHGWGELPAGYSYGGASHGTAVDSEGLIYITHQGQPGSIYVFDPKGKLVRTTGYAHVIKGRATGHGIDIRKEEDGEFMYLSPSDARMGFTKMTLKGEIVWAVGVPWECGKYNKEKLNFRPTNISFHPDGDCYLGDGYGSNLIHRYTKDGKYVSTFGATGEGKGQFKTPHGQWLDERDGTPKIVVADRANARLQYLSLEGEHLSFVNGLLFPADIDIQGDIMVVPDLHARITLYDKNNKVLAQLGDDEAWRKRVLDGFKMRQQPATWEAGKFIHPHDACFDKDGNIFVAEWVVGGRVTKLRKVS